MENLSEPCVSNPPMKSYPGESSTIEDEIQNQIWGLLSTFYAPDQLSERRQSARYPFPYLIRLTPTAKDGVTPDRSGQSVVVVGKHLSEGGLGFYHREPIPHRRMIVSLESSDGELYELVINLSWCRFTKQGWYESGGRFTAMAATGEEEDQELTLPEDFFKDMDL